MTLTTCKQNALQPADWPLHLASTPSAWRAALDDDELWVRLRPSHVEVDIEGDDQLVTTEGALPLSLLAAACDEAGVWLPMVRPFPLWTVQTLLQSLPPVAEGLLSKMTARSAQGTFSSPAAPRSAQGPDPLGLLATDVVVEQASLRCPSRTTSSWHVVDVEAHEGAQLVLDIVHAGRAFAVDVQLDGGRLVGFVLAGHGTADTSLSPLTTTTSTPAYGRHCLLPASGVLEASRDVDVWRRRLHDGARLWAAPFMHRAGWLLPRSAAQPFVSTSMATWVDQFVIGEEVLNDEDTVKEDVDVA
mgnify:CR=1 FL=1